MSFIFKSGDYGLHLFDSTIWISFWAGFGVLFGEFLQFQLHKARLLCYQSMAIVHY